jgi:hypothetical protein
MSIFYLEAVQNGDGGSGKARQELSVCKENPFMRSQHFSSKINQIKMKGVNHD